MIVFVGKKSTECGSCLPDFGAEHRNVKTAEEILCTRLELKDILMQRIS